jgi:uncharacterized membrane protein
MKRRKENFAQVSGIFSSEEDLRLLMEELHQRNITDEDVSIVMSEETRNKYFAIDEKTKAPEGTQIGGISGGLLGALIGGLTVIGSVALPGIGLVVAGPLIGALAGAGIGGLAGGLIGALVGAGVPEHEAKFYEDALKREGNIFVLAHVHKDEEDVVKSLFERYHSQRTKVRH